MGISESYKIDFSDYRKNLGNEAVSRLLAQYRSSPVLVQVLLAFVKQYQELHDAIIDLMEIRTLYGARGYYQDVLGRIVGRDRNLYTSVGPTQTADDDTYQELLLAKILKNSSKFSSTQELKRHISETFGIVCDVKTTGPMEATVFVPNGTSDTVISRITQAVSAVTYDDGFDVAYPSTLGISVENMIPRIDVNAYLDAPTTIL